MSLQLVGVDLETGGLNGYETLPTGERVHGAAYYPILEMAFVVCDEFLNKEFSFSVGIWDELFLERLSPWALKSHTESGLIDQLRNQSGEHLGVFSNIEDAELFAIETLMHFGVSIYDRKAKTGAVMFGNSIGFDVSFIDAQMPSLKNFFHYRTIDVSSVDLLRQTAWAGLGLPKSEKQYAHTAMSDIKETLGELVGYTEYLQPAIPQILEPSNREAFQRENRYLVLKRADIARYLGGVMQVRLNRIECDVQESRINDGRSALECVVVESDWPEYEGVWASIEARS